MLNPATCITVVYNFIQTNLALDRLMHFRLTLFSGLYIDRPEPGFQMLTKNAQSKCRFSSNPLSRIN